MYTLVQPRYWLLQLVLLCQLWQLVPTSDRITEYSSLGVYQAAYISDEDIGEITLFIIAVIIDKVGKRLDKGYRCPVYCDVNHKHYYWENYEAKESYIQTDDRVPRPDKPESREQSEGSIRPIASTD